MAASVTFALKAGVWFRRGRRCMVSPDSQAIACPLSGRNSTYRPVQISGAGSLIASNEGMPGSEEGIDKDDRHRLGEIARAKAKIGAVSCNVVARGGFA